MKKFCHFIVCLPPSFNSKWSYQLPTAAFIAEYTSTPTCAAAIS